MALARISIAEDKATLVKALRASEGDAGVFQTYGDILTFAAILGFKHKKRVPLEKTSKRDPDPVLQEQFRDVFIISFVALLETQDPRTLTFNDESDRIRVQIFQEYANGGLEILKNKLHGVTDYLGTLLLIINAEKDELAAEEEFDWTKYF